MARLMALDVGAKTIGVALSDECGEQAFPAQTLIRSAGWRRDMSALRALVAEHRIAEIVVGLPLLARGEPAAQVERVQAFVARLRGSVRVPIRWQDERFSTQEAEAALLASGVRRSRAKASVDSVAAALILRAYLDSRAAAERAG